MQTGSPDWTQIKDRMRSTWMAGDFGQIARHATAEAEAFVSRLKIAQGMKVLDVACGTGNLSIPAARLGADVVGVDIAPNLLEQARARAQEEKLHATFDEGDAEQLPYPDENFDLVMSMFGAMFAPRPDVTAGELMRVCKRGGTVAMANWTPGGFTGKMFRQAAQYLPPPPGVASPALWGDEAVVRQRFAEAASKVETSKREIVFDYAVPARDVVHMFREYFGPTRVAFSMLDEAGQRAYAADLERLWSEGNEGGDGRTLIRNEYLEVIATRA